MKKALFQFSRYVLVGGAAFVVDFVSLYLLTDWVGLHYLVSATLAFLLGLATNYLLCTAWVFDVRRLGNRVQEFTIFALVGVAGLALNNLVLFALTSGAGIHYLASKLAAAALVLFFNFFLRRNLLFTKATDPA
jgi:putative flippase GtrA